MHSAASQMYALVNMAHMNSGQLTVYSEQWAVDSGQWSRPEQDQENLPKWVCQGLPKSEQYQENLTNWVYHSPLGISNL